MYRYQIAYRHDTGDIEGFVGIGSTPEASERDSIEQLRRKLDLIRGFGPFEVKQDRIIRSFEGLVAEERGLIQQDWASTVRY